MDEEGLYVSVSPYPSLRAAKCASRSYIVMDVKPACWRDRAVEREAGPVPMMHIFVDVFDRRCFFRFVFLGIMGYPI